MAAAPPGLESSNAGVPTRVPPPTPPTIGAAHGQPQRTRPLCTPTWPGSVPPSPPSAKGCTTNSSCSTCPPAHTASNTDIQSISSYVQRCHALHCTSLQQDARALQGFGQCSSSLPHLPLSRPGAQRAPLISSGRPGPARWCMLAAATGAAARGWGGARGGVTCSLSTTADRTTRDRNDPPSSRMTENSGDCCAPIQPPRFVFTTCHPPVMAPS